jgi:CubicO group peptidase (beta-lactamase class C family)
MKKLLIVILLESIYSLCTFAQPSSKVNYASKIDSILNTYAEQDLISGSFLVAEKNTITFSKGYNHADRAKKRKITPKTAFRIASVSKPLTAAAILLLDEKGLMSVSDKLSKYLPYFPNGDSITIHHLLSHTSGIVDVFKLPFFSDSAASSPITINRLIDVFKDVPLEFQPGNKFKYSNSGYIILSQIIQKVSGQSYDTFIMNNIFKPCGMKNSGMWYSKENDNAMGYTFGLKGIEKTIIPHESVLLGAGALYSTTEDLFKFCSALLEYRLLKKETVEKMITPYSKEGYGYGWFIKNENEKKTIWHQGGISGFSSYIQYSFNNQVLIVGLKNNDRLALLNELSLIESLLLNKAYQLPMIYKEIIVQAGEIKKYEGEYEITPKAKLRMDVKNDYLIMTTPDGSRYRLYPSTNKLFFLKVMDIQCEFILDENKTVSGLNWIQKGRKLFTPKI